MNKSELVSAIAEGAQLSKAQAKAALDATLDAIAGALAKDDKVTLVGFGTFAVAKKEERKGINPRTKETITIPARNTIKFKAGSELNDKVK